MIGKAERSGMRWYYLDEGVYGSFSGQIFDHVRYPLEIFSDAASNFPSVPAGPTCDSIDLIAEDVSMPELKTGDFLVGHMMGAYTAASATEFNSFPKTKIVVYDSSAANMLFMPFAGSGQAIRGPVGSPESMIPEKYTPILFSTHIIFLIYYRGSRFR